MAERDDCAKADILQFLSADLQFSSTWNRNTRKAIDFKLSFCITGTQRVELQSMKEKLWNPSPSA